MASEDLNPIACVLCRSKKCKCDRKLPSCSQCESSGLECQYPLSNKRGIPTGYISSLEHRLLETESALFRILLAIHNPQDDGKSVEARFTDVFAQETSAQSKSAKLDEWKRFSLGSDAHLLAWLNEKRSILESSTSTAEKTRSIFGPAPSRRSDRDSFDDKEPKPTPWARSTGSGPTPENSEDMFSPRPRDFALEHREAQPCPAPGSTASALMSQRGQASGIQWDKYF